MLGNATHALTLWQPWASAITHGPKRVENRPWPPPANMLGQRIWIHAGTFVDRERWHRVACLWPGLAGRVHGSDRMPAGAIIGSAIVAGYGFAKPGTVLFGAEDIVRGAATEAVFRDPWWMGPHGWVLADVRALERPVPCRGYQKLWRVPADVLAKLEG